MTSTPTSPAPPLMARRLRMPAVAAGGLGTRSHLALTYAARPGFRPLLLDLHLPPENVGTLAAPEPPPLVVFVHGGGWMVGDRAVLGPGYAGWTPTPFERIAAAGIAVATVDYRLSGEATWPAQLDDVVEALRWLRTHASELGVGTDRIALWGESAGGHLAALAGLLGEDRARGGGPIEAVVDWYGPADLLMLAAHAGPDALFDADAADSRESRLLGSAVQNVPELATDASPVHHVSSLAPPFLIVHGSADRFVSVRQSELLAEALTGCGVPVSLHVIDGADHMWLEDAGAAADTAFDLTLTFLLEHLLPDT